MRNLFRFAGVCLALPLCVLSSSCGGGLAVLAVPLFEFGFAGATGAVAIQAFFSPDQPTTSTGTFTGVNMNFDATQVVYDGTWSGCTLVLTVSTAAGSNNPNPLPAPAATAYAGQFTGHDVIRLTPTAPAGLQPVDLTRIQPATLPNGC